MVKAGVECAVRLVRGYRSPSLYTVNGESRRESGDIEEGLESGVGKHLHLQQQSHGHICCCESCITAGMQCGGARLRGCSHTSP